MRGPRCKLLVVVSSLLGVGCTSSGGYGSLGSNTGKHASSVGASTGASAGAGGTAGGSAATSGGTSGTTGAPNCGAEWVAGWENGGWRPDAGECASGYVELKGRLTDICDFSLTGGAPITIPFTAQDALNPALTATTAPCGVYWYCVEPGTQLTPLFELDGYLHTQLATLDLLTNGSQRDNDAIEGLGLFCSNALSGAGLAIPVVPTDAVVVIAVYIASSIVIVDGGCSMEGWTFTLYGPDGGPLVTPSLFISGSDVAPGDGGTTGEGYEVFYNLDPALDFVTVSGFHPDDVLPDGGPICPELSTTVAQFTGSIPITGATLTQFNYVVPF